MAKENRSDQEQEIGGTMEEEKENSQQVYFVGRSDKIYLILSPSDTVKLRSVVDSAKRAKMRQQLKLGQGRANQGAEEEEGECSSDCSGVDLSALEQMPIGENNAQQYPMLSLEAESSVSSFSSIEYPAPEASTGLNIYSAKFQGISRLQPPTINLSDSETDLDDVFLEFEVASITTSDIFNPIEDPNSSSSSEESDEQVNELRDSNSISSCSTSDENDADVFADESDSSIPLRDNNTASVYSDSELSETDKWPCHQCKCLTSAVTRYCLRCFKIRRNWLPSRPTHKGKRKADANAHNNRKRKRSKRCESSKVSDSSSSCSSSLGTSSSSDSDSDSDIGSPQKKRARRIASRRSTATNNSKLVTLGTHLGIDNISQINSSGSGMASSSSMTTMCDNSKIPRMTPNQSSSSTSQDVDKPNDQREPTSMAPPSRKLPMNSSLTPKDTDNENLSKKLKLAMNPVRVEPVDDPSPTPNAVDLCNVCHLRPKNSAFVHNKIAHNYSCWTCSDRILKSSGKCPICRAKILKVVKIITV